MKNLNLSLQMYPLQREAEKDLRSTLEKIKECGYDGVELGRFFGREAGEIRRWLDEIGLKAFSCHVPLDEFLSDLDGTIRAHRELGCEMLVLGWLDEPRRHTNPSFEREVLPRIREIAEACRKAGMPLAYHNHDFEFQTVGGRNGLEIVLDSIPVEDLQMQLDAGWAGIMGADPIALLKKYDGRYDSVHLKDFIGKGADRDFCPVGMGAMDYPPIIRTALEGGARWFVVDQDSDARHTAFEAARLSCEYLRSISASL